ncbi:hypothetical protein AB1Y20_023190 [Prymnesium parvum]|uniref:Phosphoglycerate mutase (2,3-diphosphoglycerate-dependent) n=1 Tax=Prymnesium parvum TaxID=97485 RepID=A0AB34JDE1_PRYPA
MAMHSGAVEVLVVRHAERLDETEQKDAFYRTCGDRWWDPPLSARGVAQASSAGAQLRALHARQPFDEVLCSPTLRTMQTASYIAKELELGVRRVPGLAACAAAIQQFGIGSFRPSNQIHEAPHGKQPKPRFLSEKECEAVCAPGTRFLPEDTMFEQFEPCVRRVAMQSSSRRVLIVSHREGIRELRELAGSSDMRTPYCCISRFLLADCQAKWIYAP